MEGWDPTLFLSDLRARKPMVVARDLNCARTGMDVYDAKRLVRSPGSTIEERMSLDAFLKSGWIDSFKELHPTLRRYTYFSNRNGARHRNVGWRLHNVLLSAGLLASSAWIDCGIALSDHQPVGAESALLMSPFRE
ncbi:g1196 [Coccomyxa elongata]